MALVEYLPLLIPMLIFASIGVVSLFWYTKTRRTGFLWIGIGFLVQAVPSLLSLALGGSYFVLRLVESGLSYLEIGQILYLLYLLETAMTVAFAALVLIGLVFLAREFQK
jgi:hypothetical protein